MSSYFFTYNTKFENGSYAIGPTISVNTDMKVSLQFGVLVDRKLYTTGYVKTGYFQYKPVKSYSVFMPLYLHFEYFRINKIALYATTGVVFGGRNSYYNNSILNFVGGTGISYRPFKYLSLKAYPNIRCGLLFISPGVSFDVCFLFNSEKFTR